MSTFTQLVDQSEIVSFVGTGGVGKTTYSMATAIAAAMSGKKVAAITIDPSRRLTRALGLSETGSHCQSLDWPEFSGSLDVYILDVEVTFQEFVSSHLSDKFRESMLKNRVFKQISRNLRETHNFAAMYKLHQIASQGDYDLVVLDTPPSQAALDFFEAPERLKTFFAFEGFNKLETSKWASWVGEKSLMAFKLLVDRFAGGEFLDEMLRFFDNVKGLKGDIETVSSNLIQKMSGPSCHFVLVTSSAKDKLEEALDLTAQLEKRGFVTKKCVINQAYPLWMEDLPQGPFRGGDAAKTLFDYFAAKKAGVEALSRSMERSKVENGLSVSIMPSFPFSKFEKEEIIGFVEILKEKW